MGQLREPRERVQVRIDNSGSLWGLAVAELHMHLVLHNYALTLNLQLILFKVADPINSNSRLTRMELQARTQHFEMGVMRTKMSANCRFQSCSNARGAFPGNV